MAFVAFTEEEKNIANEADIVAYLQHRGESVKREGNEFAWQASSGKVSIRGNQWYSQYEQLGGATVSFVRKFFGLSFPDAIQSILGTTAGQTTASPHSVRNKPERKEFALPEKHSDMRRAYAYLVKDRCLHREIVHNFASRGLIYEDSMHNVVFVGCDENGTPRHAQKRSTNPASSFKQNVAGSAAEYSFHHVGTSDRLYVFEAPIDMLAFITMNRNHWAEHSYVALASTADKAAVQMLRSYPHLRSVYLCLDHDAAGIEGGYRIADSIHELGDWEVWRVFPKNKDWDEDLKAERGMEVIPASEHPKIEYVSKRCEELRGVNPETDYIFSVLSKAKGYLLEDTFDKMKLLLEKLEQVEQPKQKEQQLMHLSKVAVSFVVLRAKQCGLATSWNESVDRMRGFYKPNHDTACADIQLKALRKGFDTLEDALQTANTLVRPDIAFQNDAMLRFGLCCISAACALHMEMEQGENQAMTLQ